jgi:3-hydroxybutyryl-CoA dehydratase
MKEKFRRKFMASFKVGDQASIRVRVTDKMVRQFAELSGDNNPIHLDEAFAAKTRFGKRVAHGMISGALISRALATTIPGPGGLYLGQTLKFTAPVFIDDELEISITVTAVREDKGILTLETVAKKTTGEIVVKGEATGMIQA